MEGGGEIDTNGGSGSSGGGEQRLSRRGKQGDKQRVRKRPVEVKNANKTIYLTAKHGVKSS